MCDHAHAGDCVLHDLLDGEASSVLSGGREQFDHASTLQIKQCALF